jgi:hypothetical protein
MSLDNVLEVDHLSIRFGKSRRVLTDLSFQAPSELCWPATLAGYAG